MDGKDIARLVALEVHLRRDRVRALAVGDQGIGFDLRVDDLADVIIEHAGRNDVFLGEPKELCGFVHNSLILPFLCFYLRQTVRLSHP